MASRFVGRQRELGLLAKRLDRVRTTGAGAALTLRGRRQVGKSRLVQEFCDRAGVPYVFSAAIKGASPVEAVTQFLADLRSSGIGADPELQPAAAGGWPDAFRALATALPDRPTIVVLDELPWLAEQDPLFDGALQNAWDRLLVRRPVLLLLLGSDVHMMDRLTAHDQPFYGRADTLVLDPLTVAETGRATGLTGADAVDAHLVSGGLPGILRSWPHGLPALAFLEQECDDPASAVFGVPESSLLAEFPLPDQARRVLEAVGSGERTHATIAAAAGGGRSPVPSGSLSPLLGRLVADKRVLAVDEPLAVRPGRPALYRVADPSLRLYLAMLREAHELSRRGRPGTAIELVRRRWTSWRGRAVEPLVRQSLELAAADGRLPFPDVRVVGGWWNRQFDPEVDLVGADRGPVARSIGFVGSVKWLGTPFDRHDLAALRRAATAVPGHDPAATGTVVVSLSGTEPGLDLGAVLWTADDVVDAWR
ncbi:ATP-binding protein [Pseudonocardia broussonetiae]|uniref:ATP-binding protein n=1 Tax=Pseudonocardia broussonetiae TaxID=2736640 RepID=A0A6M6JF73_9PSEU|nr:ATP-binding protein [Pseudonocardia broussonetiae]QJY46594.1 ATP-binding protein [Pseudonocardia broussonetiae]